jgi:hypothetical protein
MSNRAIRITHETSPAAAVRIARTQVFYGAGILGDAGLNAVIPGHHPDPYCSDQAAASGAILHLEWSGKIVRVPRLETVKYEPGILYDQHPHRAFIFAGPTHDLRLVRIELRAGATYEAAATRTSFPRGRSAFKRANWSSWIRDFRHDWTKHAAARIQSEMDGIAAQRPVIRVMPNPNACYRNDPEIWGMHRLT